jgi:hypothetical protein
MPYSLAFGCTTRPYMNLEPRYNFTLGGPHGGLGPTWGAGNLLSLPGLEPRTVQLIASHPIQFTSALTSTARTTPYATNDVAVHLGVGS